MAKRGVSQKEMNSMKSDDASDQQRLLAQISDEMTLPRFDGVFDEMRPKVVEFGYVTMFSAALPLSLVGTALVNVIELRADAAKVLFQFRRPRYRGADGIGKWRHIIASVSWLALIVNAFLIVYTSTTVRDQFLIPMAAATDDDGCTSTADPSLIALDALHVGTNISWQADCPRNYLNCYAVIGGEPWLPASVYLDSKDLVSRKYYEHGLCHPSSALYNAAHCALCEHRRERLSSYQVYCLLALEHMLLATYLLCSFAIPDEPRWVKVARAREAFRTQKLEREVQQKEAEERKSKAAAADGAKAAAADATMVAAADGAKAAEADGTRSRISSKTSKQTMIEDIEPVAGVGATPASPQRVA